MKNSLFAVAGGIIRVRCEGERGKSVLGEIMSHVVHAYFLAPAENAAYRTLHGDTVVLHGLHTIERDHSGALVVGDASAVKIAVLLSQCEGVGLPSLAGRHHINMTEHSRVILITATAKLRVSGEVVAVFRREAEAVCEISHELQCFG